jgi:hypothetical protein
MVSPPPDFRIALPKGWESIPLLAESNQEIVSHVNNETPKFGNTR